MLRTLSALALAAVVSASAQDTLSDEQAQHLVDSVQGTLSWKTGHIDLPGGKAALDLPVGYRYLAPDDARKVLELLWGNPSGEGTLGMIFAPGEQPVGDSSWGVVVNYNDEGHVDDDDAADTDFDELLKTMQKSTEDENEERVKAGYGKVALEGWAEKPHYDETGKKLWWAKILDFDGNDEKTLNYYVRILGREGVLELNAVSGMGVLPKVREGMTSLNTVASFTAGNRYADFNKDSDRMSKLGIAALIGGGAVVAAKTGLLKGLLVGLLAAKKFLAAGAIAAFAGVKAWWSKRKQAREEREAKFGGPDLGA